MGGHDGPEYALVAFFPLFVSEGVDLVRMPRRQSFELLGKSSGVSENRKATMDSAGENLIFNLTEREKSLPIA